MMQWSPNGFRRQKLADLADSQRIDEQIPANSYGKLSSSNGIFSGANGQPDSRE